MVAIVWQLRVELQPEAVEGHREAGVRADDEHELHELALVELLRQPGPRLVVDAVAVDELVGRARAGRLRAASTSCVGAGSRSRRSPRR